MSLSATESKYENVDMNLVKEYVKIATRMRRHGDPNVVMKKGRKEKSVSHKKRTTAIWNAKQKEKRRIEKERLLELGIAPKIGRPKKIID
jgi:hypothetical protein